MEWALCVICQQDSNKALKCPLNAPGRADKSGPYKSRVCMFRELDLLPVAMSHLTEDTNADDLATNSAKWHKSCYNKFGQDRLDRARKRKRADLEAESSDDSTTKHVCPHRQSLDKCMCIFCEEVIISGRLHQFT